MKEILILFIRKIFFLFLNLFSKNLLKKYFPLIEHDLQCKIETTPYIYINEEINHCNISFTIDIKNYTDHDLLILFVDVELVIEAYQFLKCNKIIFETFSKKGGKQLYFEIPLTYYQVRKIISMKNGTSLPFNADFSLRIHLKNKFYDAFFSKRLPAKIIVQHTADI